MLTGPGVALSADVVSPQLELLIANSPEFTRVLIAVAVAAVAGGGAGHD